MNVSIYYSAIAGGINGLLFYCLLFTDGKLVKWMSRVILKLELVTAVVFAMYFLAVFGVPGSEILLLSVPLAMGFFTGAIAILLLFFILKIAPRGTGGAKEKPTDIRDMDVDTRRLSDYDVMRYNKRGYVTLGICAKSLKSISGIPVPVRIKLSDFFDRHMQIMGTTGSGKTLTAQMIFRQLILKKYPVIVINPKAEDRFLPYCLYAAAKQASVPYRYVNLNAEHPPQINPLIGANEYEMVQLLETVFGLGDKGSDSDFYRGEDRDACVSAAKILMGSPSFSSLVPLLGKGTPAGFLRKVRELARLQTINAREAGVDFYAVCNTPGVLYVDGSVESAAVKQAMSLIITKISQEISRRSPRGEHTPVSMFLDELKYVFTPSVLAILSTLRAKGLHLLVAHQSATDFLDIPGIDGTAAAGITIDNTDIKQVYQVQDPDTRERLCRAWGYKPVFTETQADAGSTYVEHQGYLIDPNTLATLPKRFAVTSGAGQIERIVFTSPQFAPEDKSALQITPCNFAAPEKSVSEIKRGKETSGRLSNYDFKI